MTQDQTAEFVDLYNRLESAIREAYDVPREVGAVAWLIKNERSFGGVRDALDYCREVRNLLQHNERVGGEYAVVPSPAMLDLLRQTTLRVERMPRAIDLCTKAADVCCAGMGDRVLPVMTRMAEKSYTHAPILEDGRVVGVFSESPLMAHLVRDEIVEVGEKDTFAALAGLLPVGAHGGAETFAFVAEDALATEVAGMFRESLRRSERLGMVFVTAHGDEGERMLGVITAWDMAAFF